MQRELDEGMLHEMRKRAAAIRRHVVRMTRVAGSHVGGSLSCADILSVLYFGVMRQPPEIADQDADRFILSAGHKSAAYYAVLAEKGFFDIEELSRFQSKDGFLAGHPTRKVPGVAVATGSLGHGLSIGIGLAYAARHDGRPARIFVLMGDGETQEGSVWEAAMAASQYGLDNLVAIIDRNRLQIQGRTEDIVGLEPMALRWSAFGWAVREVDGHDVRALFETFESVPFEPGKPSLVIARTVKGKGVPFIEDEVKWHHGAFTEEQEAQALLALEGQAHE